MIPPVGSAQLQACFVTDAAERAACLAEAEHLPDLIISSQAAANAVMLGAGYFSPLPGFMNLADALGSARQMRLANGAFFPLPVLCLTDQASAASLQTGQRIALRDPNRTGNPVLAIMTLDAIQTLSDTDKAEMTQHVYRTQDPAHVGVATFNQQGNVLLSGPLQVLNFSYFSEDFPETFRTAGQIRAAIAAAGWQSVVAFQTRNPMHRAHEALCKIAMERLGCDGLIIHMLLGKLKPGDIPAAVRDAAIRTMVEHYFAPNSVMIAGYGFDMLYAGPREAVLHAYFRQNMGATHFIIGRDHAGVGDYYGAFDAQTIFAEEVPHDALQIQIFNADHTAYSTKLDQVVMMREVTDHTTDDFVLLSGTRVREMLSQGQSLPASFSRPEVAEILMAHYQVQG
ncbi:MAG: sulfate adenylyltransferase [Pseudomonadota bacterium]